MSQLTPSYLAFSNIFVTIFLLYVRILRVQIHANCRIRRIYFSDRLYSEDELPPEFKLFLPIAQQNNMGGQDLGGAHQG
jgi:Protein of unknown function (DUF667)